MIKPEESTDLAKRVASETARCPAYNQFLARAHGKEWRRFLVRQLTGVYIPLDQER
jgi:hypothetical protein